MTVNSAVLRLAGALLPAAVILHEAAYAVVGRGAESSTAHGYLAYAIPIGVAAAVALIAAGLLLPVLRCEQRGVPDGRAPLALAAALVGIFFAQEGVEALVLGGGGAAVAAALTVAWLVLPMALTLGLLATRLIALLDSAVRALIISDRFHPSGAARSPRAPLASVSPTRLSPLAFGLASRPPPAR